MNNTQNEMILAKALKTYGYEHQRMVLIEECGELLDAIAKHNRGRADVADVITELADVHIMVEQMAIHFGKAAFHRERDRKITRLINRLNHVGF